MTFYRFVSFAHQNTSMVNQCERELSAVAAYEVLPLRPKNRRYYFLKDQNSSERVGVDTLTLA